MTNAKTPGARCYGYVTMSTSDDAEKCIQHLHRTELHGRVISVEKVCIENFVREKKKQLVSISLEFVWISTLNIEQPLTKSLDYLRFNRLKVTDKLTIVSASQQAKATSPTRRKNRRIPNQRTKNQATTRMRKKTTSHLATLPTNPPMTRTIVTSAKSARTRMKDL